MIGCVEHVVMDMIMLMEFVKPDVNNLIQQAYVLPVKKDINFQITYVFLKSLDVFLIMAKYVSLVNQA